MTQEKQTQEKHCRARSGRTGLGIAAALAALILAIPAPSHAERGLAKEMSPRAQAWIDARDPWENSEGFLFGPAVEQAVLHHVADNTGAAGPFPDDVGADGGKAIVADLSLFFQSFEGFDGLLDRIVDGAAVELVADGRGGAGPA